MTGSCRYCSRTLPVGTEADEVVRLGRLYGYPECCIHAFVSDDACFRAVERPSHSVGSSRYVMCEDCADREMPGWRQDGSWRTWRLMVHPEYGCGVLEFDRDPEKCSSVWVQA